MSEVKVNKISPRTNCGTVTLGDSGDTFTIPSGATITNSGTATGFGATGAVNWDTASIKSTGFTAVSGNGYFCNTSGGAFTATLPASPTAGDIVAFSDYTRTFQTYTLTVGRNSKPIGGVAQDAGLSVEGQSATFVFVDDTEGWINTQETQTSQTGIPPYICATGGTPCSGAICGNCKVHTFTGPGTFTVGRAATCAADNLVSYMVVAGGGGGGNAKGATNGYAGGAGAGGFRELVSPTAPYTASPLDGYPSAPNRITVTATAYPITVGGGGANVCCSTGTVGDNSVFSSITAAGGGGGESAGPPGVPTGTTSGGSGGGANNCGAPGAGNTPPTTPAQGTAGGAENPGNSGGGGGGATVAGTNGAPGGPAGPGGAGATSSITGSPVARAGGGGGGGNCGETGGGTGGTGGGGAGGNHPAGPGTAGTVNTGGGGGGSSSASGGAVTAGAGGSGVVILRYKFQ